MREARAVMADLAGSGLTADQLALVMELAAVVASEARPAQDESAQRRRAKDRDRKRIVRGNPQTSAESAESAEPKKVSPTPPSKKQPTLPLKGDCPSVTAFDFERWWASYPKRVAKGQARKAYATALRKTSAETLQIALDAAQFSAELRFVPHPSTWLTGECWLDGTGAPSPTDPPPDDDPWPRRVREFERNGFWNTTDWGPKPGKPDSQAQTARLERAA